MLRILTITTLYPNPVQIRHGVFVRDRLRQFAARYPVERTVVAPVPWFPLRSKLFGRYADFARVPEQENGEDPRVFHPRFAVLPKVGGALMPISYYRSVHRLVRSANLAGVDAIDAHYAFPDGAAAVLLGRKLKKPVVLTVRGSDINLMPNELAAGAWIRWALPRCDAVVAVSADLASKVTALTGGAANVTVLQNGVDRTRFDLLPDRSAVRRELGLAGPVVLSVGNLIELKGHHLVIDAIAGIEKASLIIIGKGPMKNTLQKQIERLGLGDRVQILDELTQEELVRYYNAADCLVLASSNEGLPNVLLESLACGTPVVATAVGGAPEILTSPGAGRLLNERSSAAITDAVSRILADETTRRGEVRAQVSRFDWALTASGLAAVFDSVCHKTDAVPEREVRT